VKMTKEVVCGYREDVTVEQSLQFESQAELSYISGARSSVNVIAAGWHSSLTSRRQLVWRRTKALVQTKWIVVAILSSSIGFASDWSSVL
jgi:hypothetical protein